MVAFFTLEAMEDQQARQEVHDFAVETFLRQRQDRQEVRRRAQEALDPRERQRCREAVLTSPEPSLEECLAFSRRIRRKREVDNPSTIVAP